jgi:hypothetical protein
MRPKFEGDLPLNIRHALLPELNAAIASLESLLDYELQAIVVRNLSGGLRELIKARASIGLAAMAAEQEAQG